MLKSHGARLALPVVRGVLQACCENKIRDFGQAEVLYVQEGAAVTSFEG